MNFLEAALDETASYPLAATLSRFESHLNPEWIEQALHVSGVASLRRRRLPAEQVVWLVLGMALMRDRPIDEVVASLDLALPGSRGAPPSRRAPSAKPDKGSARSLFSGCSSGAQRRGHSRAQRSTLGRASQYSRWMGRRCALRTPPRRERSSVPRLRAAVARARIGLFES